MRHARENTDLYGRRYRNRELVWEVTSAESDEDYYHISLTFRPAGGFQGEPGVDRISIDKVGEVGFRQVISEPVPKRRCGFRQQVSAWSWSLPSWAPSSY